MEPRHQVDRGKSIVEKIHTGELVASRAGVLPPISCLEIVPYTIATGIGGERFVASQF